jgi:hypothetical protein
MLLLDDYLKRNPDSLVTITHEKIRLAGILTDSQLVQSLSATYGNEILGNFGVAGSSLSARGEGMSGKKGAFTRVMGAGMSAAGSYATSKHTLIGTVNTYEGSGEINIPINCTLFYDWAGNADFKGVENSLNLMTQPKIYPGGLMGSNLYEPDDLLALATLNYDLFKGKLLQVRIGEWFLATDVFATSLNKNYITNANEDGKPVAIQVSFQIKPYRQLSAEELTDWIL